MRKNKYALEDISKDETKTEESLGFMSKYLKAKLSAKKIKSSKELQSDNPCNLILNKEKYNSMKAYCNTDSNESLFPSNYKVYFK